MCCDLCPTAFHIACLEEMGVAPPSARPGVAWACPHHRCEQCDRSSGAAGGLLFRCAECPKAFCEDCLPDDAQIITDNPHFAPLGYVRQKSACFVTCSEACAARQNEGLRGSS